MRYPSLSRVSSALNALKASAASSRKPPSCSCQCWLRGLWRVAGQDRLTTTWLSALERLRWPPQPGSRRREGGALDLAPATGSFVIQDCGCISKERCQRYGNNGPTDGFDACVACVGATSVHLPHKEGRGRVREYLEQVHIDIVSPVPARPADKMEYLHVM